MGTWPIYKKTLPTIDLNKKKLSFDKISPHDFYVFPFFSICTCFILLLGMETESDAIRENAWDKILWITQRLK